MTTFEFLQSQPLPAVGMVVTDMVASVLVSMLPDLLIKEHGLGARIEGALQNEKTQFLLLTLCFTMLNKKPADSILKDLKEDDKVRKVVAAAMLEARGRKHEENEGSHG